MSLGIPGNSVVVNILMRFPPLIPVAAAAVVTTAVVPQVVETPPAPKPVVVQAAPPAPPQVVPAPAPLVVKEAPPKFVCPPVESTAKMKKAEKQDLKAKGCKIRG